MQVVPVKIREHLIPFYFMEANGTESNVPYKYGNKRVKAVIFKPGVSSVARIMRLLMQKSGSYLKVDHFNLFLKVTESPSGKREYSGEFYKFVSGRNSILFLPEEANKHINDLLEDMFRMAFTSYVRGLVENGDEKVVTKAIDRFIDKYDLLEFGFSNDTLRRLYYREIERPGLICRFQNNKVSSGLNM